MEGFLVSICIPAYNQTVYLRKTLESISEQTYKNIEVVITDDSTNDEVHKLVLGYQDRLKIKYEKNRIGLGSPANWNRALSLAQGELIKFIHHDDWLASSETIQEFVAEFEKNKETGFVFCASEILNVTMNTTTVHTPAEGFIKRLKNDPFLLFNNNQVGSPSATMYRRNLLNFDERLKYLVDVDFYIRLIRSGARIVYINTALVVNTSNNPLQVTASSMDKQTQVGEYCYLYNKLSGNKIPSFEVSRFFITLFRKFEIKSEKDLLILKTELPGPRWYFKLLLTLSTLTR